MSYEFHIGGDHQMSSVKNLDIFSGCGVRKWLCKAMGNAPGEGAQLG
jgi:hypothetical protein